MPKPKVAFYWCASCGGCEETVVDLAEDILAKLANGKFYRNMDQCWNFGSECPYSSICFTEVPDSLTLQVYFNRKGGEADGGRVVEGAEEGN